MLKTNARGYRDICSWSESEAADRNAADSCSGLKMADDDMEG